MVLVFAGVDIYKSTAAGVVVLSKCGGFAAVAHVDESM